MQSSRCSQFSESVRRAHTSVVQSSRGRQFLKSVLASVQLPTLVEKQTISTPKYLFPPCFLKSSQPIDPTRHDNMNIYFTKTCIPQCFFTIADP